MVALPTKFKVSSLLGLLGDNELEVQSFVVKPDLSMVHYCMRLGYLDCFHVDLRDPCSLPTVDMREVTVGPFAKHCGNSTAD